MFLRVSIRQNMPVDDHIQLIFCREFYAFFHKILQLLSIVRIARTVTIILFCVHRKPHHVRAPFVVQFLEIFVIDILREP